MIKFTETVPFINVGYTYDVDKVLYKGKSKFQEIVVFENSQFGRVLVLDEAVQITERDEFFYHEMLAHIAMHAHPNPKRVVVVGGGDGGTVREVLKHKSVEKVYFIEIDEEVINVSKKFFPTVACSIDDPRVEIKCMDGAEFIKSRKGDIDVLIVDSTDPIGFARTLYSKEFFTNVKNALTDEGIYITHSESMFMHYDIVREVVQTINQVYPVCDMYTASLATYPGNWWTFQIGSKKHDPRVMRRKYEIQTKFYDEEIHQYVFVPKGFYGKIKDGKLGW